MTDIKESLVAAHKKECLYETIGKYLSDGKKAELVEVLVGLHHDDKVDVTQLCFSLKRDREIKVDLFSLSRLFGEILLKLDLSIEQTMECLHHIRINVGDSGVMGDFQSFLRSSPSHIAEAISILRDSPETWVDFIYYVITASNDPQLEKSVEFAFELINHNCDSVQIAAIRSLRSLHYPQGSVIPSRILQKLQSLLAQEDSEVLIRTIVSEVIKILHADTNQISEGCKIVSQALDKNRNCAWNAIFRFQEQTLPDNILDLAISHAPEVTEFDVVSIDFSLIKLFKRNADKAIELLEVVLRKNSSLNLKKFHSAPMILEDGEILSTVFTRWFMMGKPVLCRNFSEMLNGVDVSDQLKINASLLPDTHQATLTYLARKALGWLFYKPIPLTSVLISMIKLAQDTQAQDELADLLYQYVLLNYPKIKEYIEAEISSAEKAVATVLSVILVRYDQYVKEIQGISDIAELRVPLAQREAWSRYYNEQFARSLQIAKENSFLGNVTTEIRSRYGCVIVIYVQSGEGNLLRKEMPIVPHTIQIPMPGRSKIDSSGIELRLSGFRREVREVGT